MLASHTLSQSVLNGMMTVALERMDAEMVDVLFSHGAGVVDPVDELEKGNWLHRAASWDGDRAVLRALVEREVYDVDAQRGDGGTALHGACVMGWAEAVGMLLGKGAGVDVRDCRGRTALHVAAEWEGLGCIEDLLVQAGARRDVRDEEGRTAEDVRSQRREKVGTARGGLGDGDERRENGSGFENSHDTAVFQEVVERLILETASPATQEEKPQAPKRLIDIHTGELVPGSDDKQYIVVSYIWSPEQYQTRDPKYYGSSHQSLIPGYFDDVVTSLLTTRADYISRLPPLSSLQEKWRLHNPAQSAYSHEVYSLAAQEASRRGLRYIWIDAHCIDQGSARDKATEVPHMADYYSGATCCVVVSELLRQQLSVGSADTWHTQPRAPAAGEKLHAWLRPDESLMAWIVGYHHHRVWTFQESYLAREVVVVGGGVRIAATGFIEVRNKEHKEWEKKVFGRERFSVLGTTFPTRAEGAEEMLSVAHCLKLLQGRSCMLEHDRVYGILGLMPARLRRVVLVDYRVSVSAALVNYLFVAICAGELVNLFMLRGATQSTHGIAGAPSWLPSGYGAPFEGVVDMVAHEGLEFESDVTNRMLGLNMQYLHISDVRKRSEVEDTTKDLRWGEHNTLVRLQDWDGRAMDFLVPVGVEPLLTQRRKATPIDADSTPSRENDRARSNIRNAAAMQGAVLATFGIRKLTNTESVRPDVWLWLVLWTENGGQTWKRGGVGVTKKLDREMRTRRFVIR